MSTYQFRLREGTTLGVVTSRLVRRLWKVFEPHQICCQLRPDRALRLNHVLRDHFQQIVHRYRPCGNRMRCHFPLRPLIKTITRNTKDLPDRLHQTLWLITTPNNLNKFGRDLVDVMLQDGNPPMSSACWSVARHQLVKILEDDLLRHCWSDPHCENCVLCTSQEEMDAWAPSRPDSH